MKKILPFLLCCSLFYAACEPPNADARKMAELDCKLQQLRIGVSRGDEAARLEMEKLIGERNAFYQQLEEKYKDRPEERKKITEEAKTMAKNCLQ